MKVFVFDLDFTIWNAGDTWCSETNPPYLYEEGKLVDRSGRWIRLYPDVLKVLKALQLKGKIISSHLPKKRHPIKRALLKAANSVYRSDNAFGDYYRCMRARLGPKGAKELL